MRRVKVPALGREVSALGFGTASLGSRIDGKPALACLERAFEAGVTWFDTAPPYGAGRSEMILGEFLQHKRDEVAVCTKIGIAPPAPSTIKRLLMPAARAVIGAAPGVRAALRRTQPSIAVRPALTGEMIMASLDQSLRRLRLDAVDVLALHEPTPQDVGRDDVRRALERAKTDGKALAIGVAGDGEVACAGAVAGFDIVQLPNHPFAPLLNSVADALSESHTPITHSTFGISGSLEELSLRLKVDGDLRAQFEKLGYAAPPAKMAATLLADFAFSANAKGIVLMSMLKPDHLTFNVDRAQLSNVSEKAMQLLSRIGLGEETKAQAL